jgi:hypothetical protein
MSVLEKSTASRALAAAAARGHKLSGQRLAGLVATAFVGLMLAVHLRNRGHVFDIQFADETIYLLYGISSPTPMTSYEGNGLYLLWYRGLSAFIRDPVDLYLWGGLILMVGCAVAVYLSLHLVSRLPLYAALAATLLVFSGTLTVWPRISLAAVVVLAAGLSCVHLAEALFAKAGILVLTAFLATFVRPEFVVSFYLAAALAIALSGREIIRAIRAGRPGFALHAAAVPGWLALATTVTLIALWSFPVLNDRGRAFMAFGMNYALRYVETNHLDINPWWNYREIMDVSFPGAQSLADVFSIAPRTALGALRDNAIDLLKALGAYFTEALGTYRLVSRMTARIAIALILIACVIQVGYSRVRRPGPIRERPIVAARRSWPTAVAAAILMLPPLISCVLTYPRTHYVVLVLYPLLVCCGCALRRFDVGAYPSPIATAFAAAGLLLVTPVLPRVPQPNVQTVAALRAVPGIKVLLEFDLGWCAYYLPPCRHAWPNVSGDETLEQLIAQNNPDAILMSPAMGVIRRIAAEPLYRDLRTRPTELGYRVLPLPNGSLLLTKR